MFWTVKDIVWKYSCDWGPSAYMAAVPITFLDATQQAITLPNITFKLKP